MLKINVDLATKIIILEPQGALEQEDFDKLTETVDSYLEKNVSLHGLMIKTKDFPGWDSFAAFVKHIRFIHDHHQHIEKVALVTDSTLAHLAPFAGHFINAELKQFPYEDYDIAINWLTGAI